LIAWSALLFAGICAIGLVLSGLWAQTRFSRFEQLPAHFDVRGRATRLAPQRFVIWLTPVMFLITNGAIIALIIILPPQMINGDPNVAVYVSSAIILFAQGLVLWLLERWARNQD